MKTKLSLPALAAFAGIMLACPVAMSTFGQSADDGFNPNIRGSVYAIAVQADGKIIVGGQFNEVGGVPRTNLVRLNIDGSVDAGFNPGASEESCPGCGAVYRLAIQPDRKILVGGRFAMVAGEPRTNLARLNANGSVDTDFTAGASGGYELHTAIYLSAVSALAVQPDGKILVGGIFTNLGGLPRTNIGRLHANGTVDLGFDPSADHRVRELTLQPDGRILVGGDFKSLGGLPRSNIARLRADGSVDALFNPDVGGGAAGCFGQTWISSLKIQPDGKILAGGLFCRIGGQLRRSIARLNGDGSVDPAFDPGDTGLAISNAPVVLALQPDGKILVGGDIDHLAGLPRLHLGRLKSDGMLDAGFNPGADLWVNCFAVQADGKILVGGQFTTLGGAQRSGLGRLYMDGSLDATLNLGGEVQAYSVALQADGKIVVGGYFTNLMSDPHWNIARLNSGGSVDPSFAAEADNYVLHTALQSDGMILVSGGFTNLNGQARKRIGRLHPDGSLDSTFNPGVDNRVDAIIEQPDGRILVAGGFRSIAGQARTNIARLHQDGSLDDTFNAHFNFSAFCMALQDDGNVLAGGLFTMVNGEERLKIVRLDATGRIDSTFRLNPIQGLTTGSPSVYALAIQPDGKILVGGNFSHADGQPHTNIARLNTDGSVDGSFNGNVYNPLLGLAPDVHSIALQADGKIVVGGSFHMISGGTRDLIARLNADGNLDDTFVPGPSGAPIGVSPTTVNLALQSDGKILVPGTFFELSGQPRFFFGRLTGGSAATQRLAISGNGSSVTWMRSGSAPEVRRVTFERSMDSTNYSMLAGGTRIDGGWQATGLSLPAGQNVYIRARGWSVGGACNGSSGIIESVAQCYLIPSAHLIAMGKLANGAFQFAFTNTSGANYTVIATTNAASPVTDWEVLGAPLPVSNGLYQFTDPAATNHARRFYQLRSP